MDFRTLKGLREERAYLLDKADGIFNVAQARADKKLTKDEMRARDELITKASYLDDEIKIVEKRGTINARPASGVPSGGLAAKDVKTAFASWARIGTSLTPSDEGMELARRAGFNPNAKSLMFNIPDVESREMGVGSSSYGAKAVPVGFEASLERAMVQYGSVREVSRVVQTDGVGDLKFPTTNDTGNVGRLLTENTQVTPTDVAISEVTIGAYKFSSDIVLVSVELMQDSGIDIAAHIGQLLGERLGRLTNAYATTGTGDDQPMGCVTASTVAKTVADDVSVTYTDLVDLQHSVDPAYQSNATWMFNFSTLAALKKIVDGDNRPLWQPAMGAGFGGEFPGTILGRPYVINQQMPSMTVDAKPILYGDFSKFIWREVKGVQLMRLTERYADYHQVGFLAYLRMDSDLLDAGTHPLKCLRMAGS